MSRRIMQDVRDKSLYKVPIAGFRIKIDFGDINRLFLLFQIRVGKQKYPAARIEQNVPKGEDRLAGIGSIFDVPLAMFTIAHTKTMC